MEPLYCKITRGPCKGEEAVVVAELRSSLRLLVLNVKRRTLQYVGIDDVGECEMQEFFLSPPDKPAPVVQERATPRGNQAAREDRLPDNLEGDRYAVYVGPPETAATFAGGLKLIQDVDAEVRPAKFQEGAAVVLVRPADLSAAIAYRAEVLLDRGAATPGGAT